MTREERAREAVAQAMASKHWAGLVRDGKDDDWGAIKSREAIAACLAFADAEAAAMRERAGLDWKPIAELGTEKRCVFVTGPDDWPSVEVYNMPPFVNNAGRLVAFSQNSSNMGSMHWVTHFAEMGEGPLPTTGEVGRG